MTHGINRKTLNLATVMTLYSEELDRIKLIRTIHQTNPQTCRQAQHSIGQHPQGNQQVKQ